ncbi:unnamed protein product [Rotaria sp. Silwood2]|nr:unnamed protein product [Rotaria sp. Silwood2]
MSSTTPSSLSNFIDLIFYGKIKEPVEKLFLIGHWSIIKMGYDMVDKYQKKLETFILDQQHSFVFDIYYYNGTWLVYTQHYFTSQNYYINFSVQGKNVLYETEIKTYLDDHGSLINENELAKEVSKKLKNIIKCRRTIEKRREKRRQSKTTTIELRSNIDSNNSDNNDDPPVSLTSTTTMLPSIDRRKLDNDDGFLDLIFIQLISFSMRWSNEFKTDNGSQIVIDYPKYKDESNKAQQIHVIFIRLFSELFAGY